MQNSPHPPAQINWNTIVTSVAGVALVACFTALIAVRDAVIESRVTTANLVEKISNLNVVVAEQGKSIRELERKVK